MGANALCIYREHMVVCTSLYFVYLITFSGDMFSLNAQS